MYNNSFLEVLREIYINPGIHKRKIARNIKLSMPSVDNALKRLKKTVKAKKEGNQVKYYLDYSKDALTSLLQNVEYLRFEKLPAKVKIAIKSFLSELREKPLLVIIFGSYAKGNYDQNSDIDILLVFQKLVNGSDIEEIANRISLSTNTKISPIYIDYASFKESFHNHTKTFFKNIKKDKIIIIGVEWWRILENEEA